MFDVAARLQVLERRHGVAGQIVERGGVPVPGRSAHAPFVIAEHCYAATDQEAGEGQRLFPVLGARPMHENDRGMLLGGVGADERSGQLHVAIRETDLVTSLNLDASRRSRSATFAPPRERSD